MLSNDKVALTVITEGGAMAQIVLADDKEKINPLWNPYWIARQAGLNRPTSFARGHFVCIDGFGPVSAEERAAGLPSTAKRTCCRGSCSRIRKQGGTLSAAFSVALPLAQETFTRTYHIVDGENIVWVDSAVTSLLAFDRPVFWGEHATISAPFPRARQSGGRHARPKSKTKAYQAQPNPTRQLQSYVDFTWPMAPTVDGQMFDVRIGADEAEHHSTTRRRCSIRRGGSVSSPRFIPKNVC